MTLPQTIFEADFQVVARLRKWGDRLFWVSSGSSLALILANQFLSKEPIFGNVGWKNIINFILYLSIFFYTFIVYINEYYFFPEAERKRRKDYLDNSFGSRFNLIKSKDYFTNDNITQGIFKATVNLYENIFYTYQIGARMRYDKKIFITIGLGVILLFFAYIGFNENEYGIPLLQCFVSIHVLGDVVKLFVYVDRIGRNKENIESFLQKFNSNTKNEINLAEYLKILVDYEATISWGMIKLSDRLYLNLHSDLEIRWNKIKEELSLV